MYKSTNWRTRRTNKLSHDTTYVLRRGEKNINQIDMIGV